MAQVAMVTVSLGEATAVADLRVAAKAAAAAVVEAMAEVAAEEAATMAVTKKAKVDTVTGRQGGLPTGAVGAVGLMVAAATVAVRAEGLTAADCLAVARAVGARLVSAVAVVFQVAEKSAATVMLAMGEGVAVQARALTEPTVE